MINIIKSVNYSTKRDIAVLITIISAVAIPVFVIMDIINSGAAFRDITPSFLYGNTYFGEIYAVYSIVVLILTCKAVGGDAGDKTINYEIMSGHGRGRSFAARSVSGFLWGSVITAIVLYLPMFYIGLMNGWGLETNMEDVILRSVLTVFPLIRMTAFFIMLTSVMRSAGKGIAVGYVISMAIFLVKAILEEAEIKFADYISGMSNGAMLLTPDNSKEKIIDGMKVKIFDTALSGDVVVKTILISIAATAVYLTVAYMEYKKNDRD